MGTIGERDHVEAARWDFRLARAREEIGDAGFWRIGLAGDAETELKDALGPPRVALVLGAELGPKADPTTTTYVPRPEWYFFFLFEVLRVIKPPALVPLATVGVPTICMVLLLLLPFYDRNPERNPLKRPIASIAGKSSTPPNAVMSGA